MDALVFVEIANIAVDLGLTIGLAVIASNQREMHGLKAELKKTTTDLVRAELVTHTAPLSVEIEGLRGALRSVERKIEEGDGAFKSLDAQDRQSEVRIEKIVGDLRTYMAQTFATKADMKEISTSVSALTTATAVIANEMKHHTGHQ